mgnify:CR=1 FL=1
MLAAASAGLGTEVNGWQPAPKTSLAHPPMNSSAPSAPLCATPEWNTVTPKTSSVHSLSEATESDPCSPMARANSPIAGMSTATITTMNTVTPR